MQMMGREGRADRRDKCLEAQGFSLEVCQSRLSPEVDFPRSLVKQSELLSQLCISLPGCRVMKVCGENDKRWVWARGSNLHPPKKVWFGLRMESFARL